MYSSFNLNLANQSLGTPIYNLEIGHWIQGLKADRPIIMLMLHAQRISDLPGEITTKLGWDGEMDEMVLYYLNDGVNGRPKSQEALELLLPIHHDANV